MTTDGLFIPRHSYSGQAGAPSGLPAGSALADYIREITDGSIAAVMGAVGQKANATFAQNGTGAVARTVEAKLKDILSVKDFGAVGDGVTDDTEAFNRLWAHIKTSSELFAVNGQTVSVAGVVPAGKYRINSSINFSNLIAWNIHIVARGAVLLGHCSGKAVIDATNVRGLHIHGLEIWGDEIDTPSCGVLVGNLGTNTTGNNKFSELKTFGYYTKAAFANLGSETTVYDNCYFANQKAGASRYAYIGDGVNRHGLTSDHTALRAADTAVSFTNNAFLNCHFRNYADGPSFYGEALAGWLFTRGCYFLAYAGANIQLRQGGAYRNSALDIQGHFETANGTGVDYVAEFLVPAGETAEIVGFNIMAGGPHAGIGIFKMTDPGGGTPGNLFLRNSRIELGIAHSTSVPMFVDCQTMTIAGEIRAKNGSNLNLADIAKMSGTVICDNYANVTAPSATSAVVALDELTPGVRVPPIYGLSGGAATSLSTVTSGLLPAGVNNHVTLNVTGGATITDISSTLRGQVEITIRNASADPVTFTHNNAKIRTNAKVDLTLTANQAARFWQIATGIWQQVS